MVEFSTDDKGDDKDDDDIQVETNDNYDIPTTSTHEHTRQNYNTSDIHTIM